MGLTGNFYRILLILHILAAIVAFGPLFVYSSLRRAGATQAIAGLHMRLSFPALVAVWVLGMGIIGASDQAWEFDQTWIVLSIIGWVLLMAVSWFLVRPALSDASDAAAGRLAMGIGITHILVAVMLYLMVFKPGL
jgi:hypothetical protein